MPGYSDQYLEQGSTFNTQITLDDVYNQPMNLSGFSVSSEARKSYYSANATIVFDSTVYDAANGIIQLSLDAATSANVPAGRLVYDVVLTQANTGLVTRVLEGLVYVSPSVTHS